MESFPAVTMKRFNPNWKWKAKNCLVLASFSVYFRLVYKFWIAELPNHLNLEPFCNNGINQNNNEKSTNQIVVE